MSPPERGSWTATAIVVLGGIWALNNVKKDTPIGHLLFSAYDYVIKAATGAALDYGKPIRQLIEEGKNNTLEANKSFNLDVLDGVVERSEKSIEEIHRPIVESETSDVAKITFESRGKSVSIAELNSETFDYISQSIERPEPENLKGAISSYNINSFTGRVYIPEMGRTVPFLLSEGARRSSRIDRITASLRSNALKLGNETLEFDAVVMETINKRVRHFIIYNI